MAVTYLKKPVPAYTDQNLLGPAMRKLNVLQRNFVVNLSNRLTRNHADALREAGWEGSLEGAAVHAHYLLNDRVVQEAIIEEGRKRVIAFVPIAVSELGAMIDNPQTREENRLKAIQMVLDRAGLHAVSESKATVEHISQDPALLSRIEVLAKGLNLDVAKLLGNRIERLATDADYVTVDGWTGEAAYTCEDDLI